MTCALPFFIFIQTDLTLLMDTDCTFPVQSVINTCTLDIYESYQKNMASTLSNKEQFSDFS
ncbi:hypothetical protein B5E53_09120 [Eubacterium sp. An11]|nr:hypothetical protein B5E53_09120 [Eubacterium sp. An11]